MFQLSADGGATQKTYPVKMDFQYDDEGDTIVSDTYQIPVDVTGASGGLPTTLIALVVVVLLGGGIGGGLYYRRQE